MPAAAKVRAYVLTNKNHYSLAALLTTLAVVFGLFFYGYLRAYFQRLPGIEWLASLFFGVRSSSAPAALLPAGLTPPWAIPRRP